jgi:nitrite reductase (NADH) large subunit
MATRYAVIGAGVAGSNACQAIRELDAKGEIHVFTDEAYPFYTRIRLPELVSGRAAPERLVLKGEAWFRDHKIDLHLKERVQEIQREPFIVVTVRGRYPADRLLLATGGYSFVPPISGADLDGVFTLRTMADALQIAARAQRSETAMVIGGGLLGLEAGNGLRLRGLEVHVAEIFDRLLPRQMDPTGARILQRIMEGMGFRFYLGVQSKEIQGERGRARQLVLGDGRVLESDMFLISAGVRPHLDLAKQLDLKIGRGILVDDRMQTSAAGIYAAGDAVEHLGVYYGIWPAAEEQGRVAGVNMASGEALYEGTVLSNQLKVVGIDLVSAGEIDAEGKLESEVVSDPERGVYRKVVYEDDRIAGCILLGDVSGQRKILSALKRKVSVGFLKGRVLLDPRALP